MSADLIGSERLVHREGDRIVVRDEHGALTGSCSITEAVTIVSDMLHALGITLPERLTPDTSPRTLRRRPDADAHLRERDT